MKTYVLATGVIFGLIAVTHAWHMIADAHNPLSQPWMTLSIVVSAILAVWAFFVVRRSPSR
jgi:hypothetical protein